MGTGILNLCIGLVFVGLGLTGNFRFVFLRDYPRLPLYVGIGIAAFGAYQIIRALMRRKPPVGED